MLDIVVSGHEIRRLAEKLADKRIRLTEKERELLVAIFLIAGRQVGRIHRERNVTAKNLKEELIKAFIHDDDDDDDDDFTLICDSSVNPPNVYRRSPTPPGET